MLLVVERIVNLLASSRGRDVHRAVMLVLMLYVVYRVTEVDKALSSHLGFHYGQKQNPAKSKAGDEDRQVEAASGS
jgi:hypothetical protein